MMSEQDVEKPAGGNSSRQPRLMKQFGNRSYKYEKKWDVEDYITCNGVTILLPVLDPNEYERSVYFEMNIVKVTALKFGYKLDAIFTKGAYVDPIDKPKKPTARDEFEDALYTARVTEFGKALTQRDLKKIELFGFLLTRLSDASEAAISTVKVWEDLLEKRDPLELWKAIKATHRGGTGGVDATKRVTILENWHELRQRDDERIMQFRNRFRHLLDSMKELGLQVPSDAEQAMIFISKLHARYNEFTRELSNLVVQRAIAYPDTLEKAYTFAANSQCGIAETTMLQRGRGVRVPKNSHRSSGEAVFMAKRNSKENNDKKCWRCKKYGHFARDCPSDVEEEEDEEAADDDDEREVPVKKKEDKSSGKKQQVKFDGKKKREFVGYLQIPDAIGSDGDDSSEPVFFTRGAKEKVISNKTLPGDDNKKVNASDKNLPGVVCALHKKVAAITARESSDEE
jgi:hypothetical protein